jgi:ferritin-like metal-binding protein YciE
MKLLNDLFLDELMDMYDAEQRIAKALPKMAKAATCQELQAALLDHLEETKGHITNLEQVFKAIGEKAKGKKCQATVGLLEEGDDIAGEFKGSPAINAAVVAACQKVEHYEIASYGALHEWATLLGHSDAADLLQENLDQEKAADEKLNELAHDKNQEALGEDSESDSNDDRKPAKKTSKR